MKTLALILVLLLIGAGALAVWLRRQARKARERLGAAWEQIATNPAEALAELDRCVKAALRGTNRRSSQLTHIHVGRVMCLVRLGRLPEAEEAEAEARRHGPLSPADQAHLSRTYLDVNPQPLPNAAVDAFARYCLLPESVRKDATLGRIRTVLLRELQVPPDAGEDRFRRALAIGERLVALAPDLPWLHYPCGILCYRVNRLEEALNYLERAAQADPGRPERHHMLGLVRRALGQHRPARAAFLEGYRLAPDPAIALAAGEACLAAADDPLSAAEQAAVPEAPTPVEAARRLFQFTIDRKPGTARAWLGLGQAQWRLSQPRQALPSLQKAAQLAPQSADTFYYLGRCYLDLGQHPEARSAFEQALAVDSGHSGATRCIADLDFEDGRFADALAGYERLGPGPAAQGGPAGRLARCHLETGNPGHALQLLADQPLTDPADFLTMARAQARLGRWADALATLQACREPVTSPEYRYYLGTILAANGHHEAAKQQLLPLTQDPDWRARACWQLGHLELLADKLDAARDYYTAEPATETALALGRLYLAGGNPTEAKRHFERALAAGRDGRAARLGQALACAQLGDDDLMAGLAGDPDLAPWAQEWLGHQAHDARRSADALRAYEAALDLQPRVSTSLLCRLAQVYLQLNRYRAALPHLVEVARRCPDLPAVRHNLGLCRYHLGMAHFRKEQYDRAREEWAQARALLAPPEPEVKGTQPIRPPTCLSCRRLNPPGAAYCYFDGTPLAADTRSPHARKSPQFSAAIRLWELEATYRSACQLAASESPANLTRAGKLFEQGRNAAPGHPRWWFGTALAHALLGRHDRAADYFAEASDRLPAHAGFLLGRGLSFQGAGRSDEARVALRTALQTADRRGSAAPPLHAVAARFALSMSFAHDRKWQEAADELEPLLDHPLVLRSTRISPADVARAMVAYYALAGQRDRALALARERLGEAEGGATDLLLAVVQADAGDYAGAADTLGRALPADGEPALRTLLVSCLLAAAAERILAGDLEQANRFVRRGLDQAPAHADARRLEGALSFCRQLGDLDLNQLDGAVTRCEGLLRDGGGSPQLVRTLAVLYHRQAIAAERKGRAVDTAWRGCIQFWRQRLFDNDSFWTDYAAEYNAGKNSRERLKPEDTTRWRRELPAEMARGHAAYVGPCLVANERETARRHLGLVWEWAPDFTPPEDFLIADLREINEDTIRFLGELISGVPSAALGKSLRALMAGYYNLQLVQEANRAIDLRAQAIDAVNGVIELTNQLGSLAPHIPGFREQVLEGLRRGRTLLREADTHRAEAERLLAKVREADPDLPALAKNTTDLRDLADKLQEDLRTVNDLCRQLGA